MGRRRTDQLTSGQRWVLESAREDDRLGKTDRRIVPGLVSRGWVREVTTIKRKKHRTHWEITAAGREALATLPKVDPDPRADWQTWRWDHRTITQFDHVVDHSHRVYRPGRDALWAVLCPDLPTGQEVGTSTTLAEAVEILTNHLSTTTCERRPKLLPLHSYEAAVLEKSTRDAQPEPIDLDDPPAPRPLRLVLPPAADRSPARPATPVPFAADTLDARPRLCLVANDKISPDNEATATTLPVQLDLFAPRAAT